MEQQNGKRLMIKEMILDNFKSYAGAQRIGPFHKNFSAVVGPNGSGKSNVIDALLFVFGRRASQMRFRKVSELIHNSTHHRNLDMARVSVFFQEIIDKDADTFEVVPESEFVVSRTAHRDNKSDYYINDRKLPVKEVTTMLKDKGIDLDNNRFLILQGEVEQISLMKPKGEDKSDVGFLEYLEDIIGTDIYKPMIEDASKTLEEFTEKRAEMAHRVKAVEKELQGLEGKKQAAENYLNTSAQMQQNIIKGCQLEVHRSRLRVDSISARAATASAQLEEQLQNKEQQQSAFKEREKKLKALEKEYSHAQAAVDAAERKFKDLEREDAKNVEQHRHLNQKIKKISNKLISDAKSLEKMRAESSAMAEDVPQQQQGAEETIAQLQAAEQHLEQLTASLQPQVQQLHNKASKVRKEVAPWMAQIQEVQTRLDVAASERDVLFKRQEDAKQRLEDAEKALKAALLGGRDQQQAIGRLERELADSKQHFGDAQRKHANCLANEARLDGIVQELRSAVTHMKQDLNSQKSASQTLKALMEAKRRGEIPGFLGRLGDLGAIDKEYDTAVSTAVGALDFIVVETAVDAQKGVELLRRNNLGVSTFLILEKQQHLTAAANEVVQTPEGVPRLFDLVKVQDPSLRVAFFYAMRNTVVAKDLEQASRIGYAKNTRWSSVVTLQGELISQSGTMSGGGGKPRGGRMQLGTSAPRNVDAQQVVRDLAQAEQRLAQATQELEAARGETVTAANKVKQLEKQINKLKLDIPKAQMEVQASEAKARDLQVQLENLQKSAGADAEESERIQVLENALALETQQLQQLRSSCQGLQQKLELVLQQIENVGGSAMVAAKDAVKNLKQKLKRLQQDITSKTVKSQSHVKQIEKLQKDMQKNEADKVKLQQELEELMAQIKQAEDAAVAANMHKQTCDAVLVEKEALVKEARNEHNQQQESFGAMNKTIDELKDALKVMQKQAKEEERNVHVRQEKIHKAQADLQELGVDIEMLTEEELKGTDAQLTARINDFYYEAAMKEEHLKTMDSDLTAIHEYRKKEADHAAKTADLNTVTHERDQVRKKYEDLRKKRLDEFMAGFNTISLRLKEMYQMITLGGDAELELVDSLDPFSEGIVFSVRPPKKSWKCIANLSGGEKTLSSLSLVFALHHFKPTPLYVMDEIDAALDFRNVSIVGHYIKERTQNAQFVIISLRNNMFELADRMVGIYKTDNCTKSVCVNPNKFHLVSLAQPGQEDKKQIPPVAVA